MAIYIRCKCLTEFFGCQSTTGRTQIREIRESSRRRQVDTLSNERTSLILILCYVAASGRELGILLSDGSVQRRNISMIGFMSPRTLLKIGETILSPLSKVYYESQAVYLFLEI